MRPYRTLPTTRIVQGEVIEEKDLVAIETALEVRIKDRFLAAFVCTPGFEKELALGYILSTGILTKHSDVQDIHYANSRCTVTVKEGAEVQEQRGFSQVRRFIGTECSAPEILRELRTASGIPRSTKSVEVTIEKIQKAHRLLRDLQIDRKKTGAFHGALIHHITDDEYVFAEDIGRHNAVDKAIGLATLKNLELTNCFVFSSGRLTADIVSKCAWTKIPLLLSFAVTTDAGVKFAQNANLTLIGAFRGNSMRIYNQGSAAVLFVD